MCVLSDLSVELFPMWHGHFQLPSFALTSSGGREKLPACAEKRVAIVSSLCQIQRLPIGFSPREEKTEIYVRFDLKMKVKLGLSSSFLSVSGKLRVNKWSTPAPRHTCWAADLRFNVSFV